MGSSDVSIKKEVVNIETKQNSQKHEKYKYPDEDTWKRLNPGKEFKPFDPYRKIPDKSNSDDG